MIYIIWQGNILEMAANDKITITDNSDVTQYRMDYGSYIGDNVVNKNRKFSLSGVVSNIRSLLLAKRGDGETTGTAKPNQKTVSDYFQLLERIRDSRDVVTLAFDPQIDNGGAQDCIITQVSYTKTPQTGDAYMVNMNLEQIRKTESATFTTRREQANPDQNQDETKSGRKPTQEDDTPTQSSLLDLTEGVRGLFGSGDEDDDGGN